MCFLVLKATQSFSTYSYFFSFTSFFIISKRSTLQLKLYHFFLIQFQTMTWAGQQQEIQQTGSDTLRWIYTSAEAVVRQVNELYNQTLCTIQSQTKLLSLAFIYSWDLYILVPSQLLCSLLRTPITNYFLGAIKKTSSNLRLLQNIAKYHFLSGFLMLPFLEVLQHSVLVPLTLKPHHTSHKFF